MSPTSFLTNVTIFYPDCEGWTSDYLWCDPDPDFQEIFFRPQDKVVPLQRYTVDVPPGPAGATYELHVICDLNWFFAIPLPDPNKAVKAFLASYSPNRNFRSWYGPIVVLKYNTSTQMYCDGRTTPIAIIDGYGILAQCCDSYDAHSVIRAAERKKSPAIIQIFPVTLDYGKGPFLQFCLNAARQASVPIAVHLDYATDPEHIELALSLAEQGIAFDSIMVDANHADTDEENIALARPHVERAARAGVAVAVEVELGRLEGGE
ncbi:hypothetical protein EW145_g8215 [Phellinidium pouzarii]|uniref:Fructose-bisphosphate aldolase n=1 Tax=Phellinidium pouzarii TaxID=167371 RepID=A0A4S4K882_9AGAM|nr:hypothetical protein EW145_g8215 [Phellinidium pouzarii]